MLEPWVVILGAFFAALFAVLLFLGFVVLLSIFQVAWKHLRGNHEE